MGGWVRYSLCPTPPPPAGDGGIGLRSPPFGRPFAALRGVPYGAARLRRSVLVSPGNGPTYGGPSAQQQAPDDHLPRRTGPPLPDHLGAGPARLGT